MQSLFVIQNWAIKLWHGIKTAHGPDFLGAFRKLRKATSHVCVSVHPSMRQHGTIRLPPDAFCLNLVFEKFSKLCRENSIFIKIWEEFLVLYMKTFSHLRQYLAEFFLEWKIFQTKVAEKTKTHTLYSVTSFPKIMPFITQCWKTWFSQRGRRWQHGACALHAALIMLYARKHQLSAMNPYRHKHA